MGIVEHINKLRANYIEELNKKPKWMYLSKDCEKDLKYAIINLRYINTKNHDYKLHTYLGLPIITLLNCNKTLFLL